MKPAYYNENNKYAAEWLRNLIDAGCIAPGVVDDRSIEDVLPSDLRGFTQCHFFAGVGVWSYALRQAGWSDDRPVWTGSCPCQPFSAAGKGTGFADERHLWPAFHHLIKECKAPTVFGEQVASKDADPWIDLVQTDLEALGYAFGVVPFPSAGVGAPHIRDRLYWVADTQRIKRGQIGVFGHSKTVQPHGAEQAGQSARDGRLDGLANLQRKGLEKRERFAGISGQPAAADTGQATERGSVCSVGGLAYANSNGLAARDGIRLHGAKHDIEHGSYAGAERPSPTNGFWRAADWLLCRDGKWRPVEPGTFPLAHGATARVGRLRAYGNAINAQAAQIFIESVMA